MLWMSKSARCMNTALNNSSFWLFLFLRKIKGTNLSEIRVHVGYCDLSLIISTQTQHSCTGKDPNFQRSQWTHSQGSKCLSSDISFSLLFTVPLIFVTDCQRWLYCCIENCRFGAGWIWDSSIHNRLQADLNTGRCRPDSRSFSFNICLIKMSLSLSYIK